MTTIITQGQSTAALGTTGVYHGFSVYSHEDGTFSAILHNRTYHPGGTMVKDKWDSSPITIYSTDKESAIEEARTLSVEHAKSMLGVS